MNWRWRDLSRAIDTLGGDTFLRGYPSGYFQGNSSWSGNVEFRTRSFSITRFFLVGASTFFDFGNTIASPEEARHLHYSTGLGLRVLIPQVNRDLLRVDVGFPLADRLSPSFVIQFAQAF
jgi:outer membrane protein assembly factor BamA